MNTVPTSRRLRRFPEDRRGLSPVAFLTRKPVFRYRPGFPGKRESGFPFWQRLQILQVWVGTSLSSFSGVSSPDILRMRDDSACASNFTAFAFSERQIPRRFASGIIPLALQTSHSSFSASVIKNKKAVSFVTAFRLMQTKKPWSPERVSTALTLVIKDQRRIFLSLRFHHQLLRFNFIAIFFIYHFSLNQIWRLYSNVGDGCQYFLLSAIGRICFLLRQVFRASRLYLI